MGQPKGYIVAMRRRPHRLARPVGDLTSATHEEQDRTERTNEKNDLRGTSLIQLRHTRCFQI
jgi:hypothetical protein